MNNLEAIKNLCSNIVKIKKENNLSSEQLAQLLNIPVHILEELEGGALPETLTVEHLVRLESKFGISLKDLFL